MKYKAVLFDYDGVVADTMEDNFSAWQFAFSKYGVKLERHKYFLMEGMTPRSVAETIFAEYNLNSDLTGEADLVKEQFYISHHSSFLHDGIESLVSEIKAHGSLTGLVSGASRERLFGSAPLDLLKMFDVIITSDQVTHGKPDPEPYTLAAEQLKLAPAECLVIENAPLGISSAKRAGMDCIAVCTTLEKKYLREADLVVERTSDLKSVLKNIETAGLKEIIESIVNT